MNTGNKPPRIIWGAVILAALSLLWSAYAITGLMHSGPFGLSVALAGDIGWITVLWAEYRIITIAGKTWAAPLAGWVIALAVGVLLVLHGVQAHSTAQAIAGPFVVLTGKTVWAFALASMKDPAALTPGQEAEINTVIRDSEYAARLHQAELGRLDRAADAEIARIRAEARTVLARDDADFEIGLERMEKRAQIQRRSPLALSPAEPPAQSSEPADEPEAHKADPRGSTSTVSLVSAQFTAPEPEARPAGPEVHLFGFSAHLNAQSAQRAQGVAKTAELLALDPGLTSGQVAEELGVSPATAKRYLREAKQPRS